jgi:HD-GYP domain-containing protein (c-di-GMP phosphodiesterase class II)
MLRRINADSRICAAALQHHERFDGSGYPRRLSEDEIDDFAAIIAIADVYDAMTAARAYRSARCAFQVIHEFEQDGLHKYKTKYILTFLERIANLYQNSQVILNDGRHAKVVYINKGALSRPIVELADHTMLDLSHERDFFISAIV